MNSQIALSYIGTAVGGVKLLVDPAQAQRAEELLSEDFTTDDSGPWTCCRCYSEVDSGFDVCWKCGSERDRLPAEQAEAGATSQTGPMGASGFAEEGSHAGGPSAGRYFKGETTSADQHYRLQEVDRRFTIKHVAILVLAFMILAWLYSMCSTLLQ